MQYIICAEWRWSAAASSSSTEIFVCMHVCKRTLLYSHKSASYPNHLRRPTQIHTYTHTTTYPQTQKQRTMNSKQLRSLVGWRSGWFGGSDDKRGKERDIDGRCCMRLCGRSRHGLYINFLLLPRYI